MSDSSSQTRGVAWRKVQRTVAVEGGQTGRRRPPKNFGLDFFCSGRGAAWGNACGFASSLQTFVDWYADRTTDIANSRSSVLIRISGVQLEANASVTDANAMKCDTYRTSFPGVPKLLAFAHF